MSPSDPVTIRLALDWTPNTIHTGLFLALKRGLYESAGLDVVLCPPSPAYDLSPAKRLIAREVDLAIVPSESIIAYHTSQSTNSSLSSPPKDIVTSHSHLKAIYAILQDDASAIVTTNPQITHLSHLSPGVYGSYNARYEDAIVRAMISHANGDPSTLRIDHTGAKLSLFDHVKTGQIDATWIFTPWEGVDADLAGVKYTAFRPSDYGVEYGYSPVICYDASNVSGKLSKHVLSQFVRATQEGYILAVREGSDAGLILLDECRPTRSEQFLRTSQEEINRYYISTRSVGRTSMMDEGNSSSKHFKIAADTNKATELNRRSKEMEAETKTKTETKNEKEKEEEMKIGTMRQDKWQRWIDWLHARNLLVQPIGDVKELYTNEFFDF